MLALGQRLLLYALLIFDFGDLHLCVFLDRSLSEEGRRKGLLVDSLVNGGPKSLVHKVQ